MKENLLLLRGLWNLEERDLQAYDCSIKNLYIDKLDEIVNKIQQRISQNNQSEACRCSAGYILNIEHNAKDPKLKVGDRVRISKNKNILAKGYTYTPNGSKEVFVITNLRGDYSFSTYAEFSEKLTLLLDACAHIRVRIRG